MRATISRRAPEVVQLEVVETRVSDGSVLGRCGGSVGWALEVKEARGAVVGASAQWFRR